MAESPAIDTAPAAAGPTISAEEVSALLEKGGNDAVRPYEFTTQRINRMQLPMLEIVSKTFAERAGSSLSALLGRDAAMHFVALDSGKAADLQAALPQPASLAIVRLKPLEGSAFVCVEPGLLLTLLDGFFGGSGRATADTQAAIAPAAQRFLALLLRSLAADLAAAWLPVAPLELELVKVETNPRLVQLGASQETLIIVRFSVEFGAYSGTIDWLLPETLLAPVREILTSERGNAPVREQAPWGPELGTALQYAELEARAVLAEVDISLGEMVRLSPGDIIPIDAPQHVTLLAGDVPIYRGRFGISRGHNALKILPGGPV